MDPGAIDQVAPDILAQRGQSSSDRMKYAMSLK